MQIPAFTELGFFKTEIPADLYQFILEQRRPFDLTTEKCPDSAHMNCERLVEGEDGKVAKEKKHNVAIMGVTDIKLFRNTINAVMQPILVIFRIQILFENFPSLFQNTVLGPWAVSKVQFSRRSGAALNWSRQRSTASGGTARDPGCSCTWTG